MIKIKFFLNLREKMETFLTLQAFVITGAFVAFLAYIKIMSYRKKHCPICGALAKKLFEHFKCEAIEPKEARKDAQEVLYCPSRFKHPNLYDYKLYCPCCRRWNLNLDADNDSQIFSCQTSNCGFSFSTTI